MGMKAPTCFEFSFPINSPIEADFKTFAAFTKAFDLNSALITLVKR